MFVEGNNYFYANDAARLESPLIDLSSLTEPYLTFDAHMWQNYQLASYSAEFSIEISNDNASLEIGFNSKYLLDITAQMGSERCRMTLADSGGPTIIQDTEDGSSLYVLMPLRV